MSWENSAGKNSAGKNIFVFYCLIKQSVLNFEYILSIKFHRLGMKTNGDNETMQCSFENNIVFTTLTTDKVVLNLLKS